MRFIITMENSSSEGRTPFDSIIVENGVTEESPTFMGQVESHITYTIASYINIYVSLRLRVQNAVSPQPCVGKFRISLVLLNFFHCDFRLWFRTR